MALSKRSANSNSSLELLAATRPWIALLGNATSPIPYANWLILLGISIIDAIERVKRNKEAFEELARDANDLVRAVVDSQRPLAADMVQKMQNLLTLLYDIHDFASTAASRGRSHRILWFAADEQKIPHFRARISHELDVLGLKAHIDVNEGMTAIRQEIRVGNEGIASMREELRRLPEQIQAVDQSGAPPSMHSTPASASAPSNPPSTTSGTPSSHTPFETPRSSLDESTSETTYHSFSPTPDPVQSGTTPVAEQSPHPTEANVKPTPQLPEEYVPQMFRRREPQPEARPSPSTPSPGAMAHEDNPLPPPFQLRPEREYSPQRGYTAETNSYIRPFPPRSPPPDHERRYPTAPGTADYHPYGNGPSPQSPRDYEYDDYRAGPSAHVQPPPHYGVSQYRPLPPMSPPSGATQYFGAVKGIFNGNIGQVVGGNDQHTYHYGAADQRWAGY
ncbi:hypothetical protein FB45DRAFT_122938 [Roridomyces roridus]|uniref:Uncharacterized protein n=1 Tax=Roridomyces roridus TaxID=1738132 RepID=A0AAD7BIY2_9AGAR|nr:hypothetical protein FB45DRAFT_122938 [Roridomyces roridus]